MNKERFDFVCAESEAGRDAFVSHDRSQEEGRVLRFSSEYLVVRTSGGEDRCWSYRECRELTRSGQEWPRR